MPELVVASNAAGAVLFALLGAMLLINWRGGRFGATLLACCVVSSGWFALQLAYYAGGYGLSLRILQAFEVLRDGAWFTCLLAVLDLARARTVSRGRRIALPIAVGAACVAQGLMLALPGRLAGLAGIPLHLSLVGFLALAVLGLVLVEQLYRNTRPEQRWSIRAFCFGVGGLFAYDVFLYAHAVLFNSLPAELWSARGAVNAVSVPLLALSAARNPQWRADIFVSRHVVFRGTAVLLVGVYLLLMSAVGYYLREYGGTWGEALRVVFFFGALLLLVMLIASSQLRARAKLLLAKHFYRNKYEYREEWLRFTRTLAEGEGDRSQIGESVVRAIASMMDCRWGILWLRHESNCYVPAAQWHQGELPVGAEEPFDSPLVRLMAERRWIIDLDQYRAEPEAYAGMPLPAWLAQMNNAWMVVPLFQRDDMLGFIVLARSLAARRLDWEDRDLLKTVALQTAGYLALLDATGRLAEASQFEAYNRLSAFVVHDLKNLAAQLSLIVANAGRFRNNPEFIDDTFSTIENAVAKMQRMLVNLRSGAADGSDIARVALQPLLEAVCSERKLRRPAPRLEVRDDATVVADRGRLAKAIGHLVQNAQEATPEDGAVEVRLDIDAGEAVVRVVDTGCGMEQSFIRDHLFRPFDTTKGNAGMGIGVYECRQIVTSLGGELDVESEPGRGSTFRVRLPLAPPTMETGE